MKALVVEDDFTSRVILSRFLSPHGECHIAKDGKEAFEAFVQGHEDKSPYDLICLDIMMPEIDGHTALQMIRKWEEEHFQSDMKSVKVVMTTSLGDSKNVLGAFREGCEAYIVKPIRKEEFFREIQKLGLASAS